MAIIVREIMNGELYALGGEETVGEAASAIVALEITAVPVLDAEQRPKGMVTLRDLLDAPPDGLAADSASSTVQTVDGEETIANAALTMARTGEQRLVVVDGAGRAIGVVSALDVVRGLVGVPARHPRAFPHFDAAAGVSWTDDAPLELAQLDDAPNGPGVLALVYGRAGVAERVTWAESCANVRARLHALLQAPPLEAPALRCALAEGHLRFRAASIPDAAERERVLGIVLGRAMADLRVGASGAA
jgi:CBS domain-containing protein